MKKCLFLLSVLLISSNLFSLENFRVHKTHIVDMNSETETVKATIGVNDALVLQLPKEPMFLKGLSFEIKIPKDVAEYRDSVAYSLYSQISPNPTQKTIDYSGNRLDINTFPGRLSCNLLVPLYNSVEFKETPYSVVLPPAMNDKSGLVFFRLQVVMKGTPLSIWSSNFLFEIKPILADKGILNLEIKEPSLENSPTEEIKKQTEGSPYTIFIDGQKPVYKNDKLILSTGSHHISIVSDIYRSEVRTVTIDQAQTTDLEVILQDIIPLIEITAPQDAQVFLDSKEIENWTQPLPIVEGSHILRFVIGGYEKVQTFEAYNGKNYKFSVSLDVQMQEE